MPVTLFALAAPSLAISADIALPVQPDPPSRSGGGSSNGAGAGPETAMNKELPSSLAPSTADALPGTAPVPPGKYVPSPVEPGWEIYVGFLAGIIPFAIGSWEFGKRIVSACAVSSSSACEVNVGTLHTYRALGMVGLVVAPCPQTSN